MEHSVQLGTQYYREGICQRLRELSEQETIPFRINEVRQGKRWLIECQFDVPAQEVADDQRVIMKIQQYYLANVLAETILTHWEQDHIRKLLRSKYKLKGNECKEVLAKVIEVLNEKSNSKAYKVHRKTRLVTQILCCLETNPQFDIEGFLSFRAHEYKEEIAKATAFAVDDYILQKEYFEFIQLLKHFVDSQTPRLHTLHVGITAQGKFHLYNDQGEKVTQQFLEDCSIDESGTEFSYEDMLISALIAVAPQQIVLHIRYNGYKDTLQTIRQVFENRVSYCSGCSLCDKL